MPYCSLFKIPPKIDLRSSSLACQVLLYLRVPAEVDQRCWYQPQVQQRGLSTLSGLPQPGPCYTVSQDVRQGGLQAVGHKLRHSRDRLIDIECALQDPTIREANPGRKK